MVKKLFKHEFIALMRSMLPIECIVLGVGILTRIVVAFENNTTTYDIIFGSSVFALAVALIGSMAAAVIFGIIRFYKNMFSREGYLSFTLPVSMTQHILVKATTAVIFEFIAIVVSLISLCIACSGDFLTESWLAGVYLIKRVFNIFNPVHINLYIIELIILIILSMFYQYLLYYACICLGQRANKHRLLLAFGIYYLYYIITQVIGTIFSIILALLNNTLFFQRLTAFIEKHTYGCIHGFFVISILLTGLLALLFFFISHRTMTKKINLE